MSDFLQSEKRQPQPAVGENSGSKDTGSRVAGGVMLADPLLVGDTVPAPPQPDHRAAAGADENTSVDGYLVASCYKKTIHKTLDEAKAQAIEQAKHGFNQEVFALIKRGQARPWSTWEGEE